MPDVVLTPRTVTDLKAERRTMFWDRHPQAPPGFGVRVSGNSRVYYVVIRKTWVKLGDVRGITLDDARKAARIAYGRAAAGEDPRIVPKRAPATDTVTVHGLIMRYIQSRRELSPVTLDKYNYEAGKIAASELGKRKAGSVVRQDVEDYLDGIESPSVRDYHFRMLRAAFRWGVDEETKPGAFIVARDPTRRILELQGGKRRTRTLSDPEIAAVWRGVEGLGLVKASYVRLLLLLGLRRGEAYKAQWTDIDLDAGTWTVPTKNRKIPGRKKHLVPDLVVPLPDLAVSILRDLKRLVGGRRPFVLSVTDLSTQLKTASGIKDVHLHAFRRTIARRLEDAEAPPHVVRLVLGRAVAEYESADLHYVTAQRPKEVRRWLEWWAGYVTAIVQKDVPS